MIIGIPVVMAQMYGADGKGFQNLTTGLLSAIALTLAPN